MFSYAYDKLLSIYISKIISTLDKQQVNIQIKNGHADLENLNIDPIFLIKIKLPILIEKSIITKMTIDISDETKTLLVSMSDCYLLTKKKEFDSNEFQTNFSSFFDIPKIIEIFTSKLDNAPFNIFNQIIIKIDKIQVLYVENNYSIKTTISSISCNLTEKSLDIESISCNFYHTDSINFELDLVQLTNSLQHELLSIEHFSFNLKSEPNSLQIKTDPIRITIHQKEFICNSNSIDIKNIWLKLFDMINHKKIFNLKNALDFLNNRESFFKEIQSSSNSIIYDKSNYSVKNEFIEYINSKLNLLMEKFNVNLVIPSISINIDLNILNLNHIEIQDQKLTINDISMNEKKISQTKPFISTQIINHKRHLTFSKLVFHLTKSDNCYLIIQILFKILSLFLTNKSVLNFQEIRIQFENEFIINSIRFDFEKRNGYIDIQGGNIDQNSSFSPFILKIVQTPITNSILLETDSLELNFKSHELFLSKKTDIENIVKKFCEHFQISINIISLKIHQKQFSIQINNYKINSNSQSYQKVEFLDQGLTFLSFDLYSINNNSIEFNNLNVYLVDSQMKFLQSFRKFDSFIANHLSIQLPDSDISISIEKIELNENINITNWTVKCKNDILIKPLTFSVKHENGQIEAQIDQVEIEIDKDQLKKLINLLTVIFKNQIVNIFIKFNKISIKLKSNESIIGHFVINSMEFEKFLKDYSITFKAQNIIDYNSKKSIEIPNPFELQLKRIQNNFYEISMNLDNLRLSFSPSLLSFYLCIIKSRFLCQFNIIINNSIISFYNSSNVFEKIQFDQLSLISKDPENFTFSMKNIQFNNFKLPSIEFSVVDSVFNYTNNSKIELNLNSYLFNEIIEFFQNISINSNMYISIDQNISLKSIQINLTDFNRSKSILIEDFKSKVNLKRGIISISKISLTNNFELNDLNFFFEFTNNEIELNVDDFKNLNSIGDVFNPTSFNSIQMKLNINKIHLNTFDLNLTKQLFDCYYSQKFINLNQLIQIQTFQVDTDFNNHSFQFNFIDLSLQISDGQFKLISNDLQIEPNQLISKQTSEQLLTVIKNESQTEIQISPCNFKFDFNLICLFVKLFDQYENIKIILKKFNIIIQTEFESPLNVIFDFKLKNKLKAKIIKTFIHSIYFLEEKPILKETSIDLKFDHEHNFLINISNTLIYLTTYLQTILNDLFNKYFKFLNIKEFSIKSISLNLGDLSIVICPISFQSKYRLNFSAFKTQLNYNESSQFTIQSCIEFVNYKIYNWDYLVEPFSIDISVFLSNSIDFNLKIPNELNVNLCQFNNQTFDHEIEPFLEKFKQSNKIYELPLFFIKNNLDISIQIKIDELFFILEKQQLLPVFLNIFPKLFELTLNEQTFKFSMDDMIYPIIFNTRLSVIKKFNCIELNSPVQICSFITHQNIYLYEKVEDNFVFNMELEPLKSYPLYFNSNKPKEIILKLNKTNFVNKEIISISPFDDQYEQISIENDYKILLKTENEKSGKVIKLYSALICENLLPTCIFIKQSNHEIIANKNSIVDLIFLSSELGTTIQFELSMNGVDYSIPNKVKIEIFNGTLKNLSIFDCRIQKEIVINAKFLKMPNGQIKMVLMSPIVISNFTENLFYIGNKIISMYDWSIFNPIHLKQDQLTIESSRFQSFSINYTKSQNLQIVLKKETKLSRKSDASDVKTPFNSLKKLFRSHYNDSDDIEINDFSVEPLNLRFQNYFLPIFVQTKIESFTLFTFSYLVEIVNNTKYSIECDFTVINPNSKEKIKAIKNENFLLIKILNEEKKFHFNLLQNIIQIPIIFSNQKFIFEIKFVQNSFNIQITQNSISPIYISNQIDCDLIKNNERPINVSIFQSNPNFYSMIEINSSKPFYFSEFDSFNLNIKFESSDSDVYWSKIFTISTENETGPIEILKPNNEMSFHVTIHQFKNIKLIHLTSQKYQLNPIQLFEINFKLFVPKLYISIIDNTMNELFLLNSELHLNFNQKVNPDSNYFQNTKNIQLNSLQINSPFIDESLLKIDQITIQTFQNEFTKFCKIQLNDIVDICIDSNFLNIFRTYLSNHLSKEKFEWFQIDPISLNLTYIDNSILNGESQRRRSSFMNFDSQNIHKFELIQIPGIVLGQFEGDYLLTITKEYFDNFITPKVQPFISLEIDLDNSIVNKKIDLDNRHIVFDVINQSSLILLALCLTKNTIEVPIQMANVLGSLPTYTKLISPHLNGFILHFNETKNLNDSNYETNQLNLTHKSILNYISYNQLNGNRFNIQSNTLNSNEVDSPLNNDYNKLNSINSNSHCETNQLNLNESNLNLDNADRSNSNSDSNQLNLNNANQSNSNSNLDTNELNSNDSLINIENRLPRCFPQFKIGKYNYEESLVYLLIRNRFRNNESIRFVSKNTLTNDLIVLTDRFLIIINPTIEFIVDEICFLDITACVVLQNEIRISGRKKNEKLTFRFGNEQITMRFNVFIASQKISLAMFGMSMIDK